jgi:hypothetical protein
MGYNESKKNPFLPQALRQFDLKRISSPFFSGERPDQAKGMFLE